MGIFLEYSRKKEFNKELIDQYGQYKVFVVNGEMVRNSSSAAEEFGGSGDHVFYPNVVPEDEIWVEDSVSKAERHVLVASELYFLRCKSRGMSKDSAYDRMLAKEKDYRDSVKFSKKNPSATDKKAHPKVYVKRYGHIPSEDIDVFLVNGNEVRNRYKVDWIEGGNPETYSFVPNHEMWIELGEHRDEMPYILLHEFVETMCMRYRKMKYDPAHKIASKVEFAAREKGDLSKEDALSLTRQKALKMSEKYL